MKYSDMMEELAKKGCSTFDEYKFDDGIMESRDDVRRRAADFFNSLCQSLHNTDLSAQTAETETVELDKDVGSVDREVDILKKEDIKEEDIMTTVLVVSHGMALRQLYGYLRTTLKCYIAGAEANNCARNTAFSTFVVR